MLQKQSLGSVKFISINRKELIKTLKKSAESLKIKYPEIIDIILFGSIARKEEIGTSDIDIVIISKNMKENSFERISKFTKEFDLKIPLDVLVYNKEEVDCMIKEKNSFIINILKEGISLFS
ncbi:nucleotidyltransferase domain-containing protein [bacterium]|nr:nucleotidyltransferase domain-containing protein [bacterium]